VNRASCGKRGGPPNQRLLDEAVRLRDASEVEAAVERLFEFVAREPSHARARAILGSLLRDFRRYDEAAEQFRRGVELRPKNWLLSSGLFHTMLALGRAAEAVTEARRYVAVVESDDPPKNVFPDLQVYRDWIDTDPAEYEELLHELKDRGSGETLV